MRAILTFSLTLLALVLFATAAQASAPPRTCLTMDGEEVVCAYDDGIVNLVCVDVQGRTVACVYDPCGTTMCW